MPQFVTRGSKAAKYSVNYFMDDPLLDRGPQIITNVPAQKTDDKKRSTFHFENFPKCQKFLKVFRS